MVDPTETEKSVDGFPSYKVIGLVDVVQPVELLHRLLPLALCIVVPANPGKKAKEKFVPSETASLQVKNLRIASEGWARVSQGEKSAGT